nr:PREDICTED: uncharacterized protein LOC107398907 isoform X1 [Tribolium castaneum]|eukprot:XP_015839954.1 PREDICTED: uncharacterized protein LOC107398907 isoform X1 [Tribolium castaneum]
MDKFVIKKPHSIATETSSESESLKSLLPSPSPSGPAASDEKRTLNRDTDRRTGTSSSEQDFSDERGTSPIPIKKRKYYKQIFRFEWREKFNFVDGDKSGTKCTVYNISIQGSLSHIKRHAERKIHIEKYRAAMKTPKIASLFKNDSKLTLKKQITKAETKIVTFFCENNIPFALADKFTELLKDDVFKNPDVLRGLKLKRTKGTELANKVLGPEAKLYISNKLTTEKQSLIIDETTDVSTKKSLVINSRFYNSDVKAVKDHFVELVEVEDSSANSLFICIKNLLDKNNVPYENIVGFGSDNASVMMGEFNSLEQKLREICPGLVAQGCASHTLHLIASHAAKKLPSVVEQFVRDVYNHFSNSTKRTSQLKEFQMFVEEKLRKMLKPCQT